MMSTWRNYATLYIRVQLIAGLQLKEHLTGIDMGDSNTIQFNLRDKLSNCQVFHDADVYLQ